MKKILLFLILSLGLIGLTSAGDFDTNILKLKATNSCVMCNLNGANLTETDLSGASLSDTTLCNTETPWGIDDSGC